MTMSQKRQEGSLKRPTGPPLRFDLALGILFSETKAAHGSTTRSGCNSMTGAAGSTGSTPPARTGLFIGSTPTLRTKRRCSSSIAYASLERKYRCLLAVLLYSVGTLHPKPPRWRHNLDDSTNEIRRLDVVLLRKQCRGVDPLTIRLGGVDQRPSHRVML